MTQAVRRQPMQVPDRPVVTARSLLAMAISLALLGAVGYITQSLTRATSFPIKTVTVEGDFRYMTPGYLQALVSQSLHGGFFQIDVQEIRRGLLEEPWVMEAKIERRWPDAIRVAIDEQQPAARWGEHALLNTAADIFAPKAGTFPQDLPLLSGPVGSEREVLATYQRIVQRVRPLGLKVAAVALSERGAWAVRVDGDTRILLGRHRIEERLDRFRHAYDRTLHESWPTVESVDLRYTNGFAIRERKPANSEHREEKRGG